MSAVRGWGRDLLMGARFAVTGGRQGWTRTVLTGVGVGLGVALLLVTAALPSALTARYDRGDARAKMSLTGPERPGPDTFLITRASQDYHHKSIDGSFVKAEGPNAPAPPGLSRLPGPGELALSPALDALLKSSEGEQLRERFDGKLVELIGDTGLIGPGELYFYAGNDTLRGNGDRFGPVQRFNAFGTDDQPDPLDPVLALLVLLTFVALLMPVTVFVAAAIRFGGEQRDRRLAALRLVGADSAMVRRIAAGEALAGSLFGLALGTLFFLVSRQLVGSPALGKRSVFPADLDPSPWLAALVAVAVPLLSVLVTLFTLRGVVIEPLGVVRSARPAVRRIWWRLLPTLTGLGLLAPLATRTTDDPTVFNQGQVGAGVVLLLVGITAVLPWLVERSVARLSRGPVSWQLAVRRLQVGSGSAARLVNGVAVAVAGAIALQILFAGTESSYTTTLGDDPTRARMSVTTHRQPGSIRQSEDIGAKVAQAEGVTKAIALTKISAAAKVPSEDKIIHITVGTCAALRTVAVIETCAEGDSFVLTGSEDPAGRPYGEVAKGGDHLLAGSVLGYPDDEAPVPWTVPAGIRTVASRPDPNGELGTGLLTTPSVAPPVPDAQAYSNVYVLLDPAVPDAVENVRTATYKADPLATAYSLEFTKTDGQYGAIRAGLYIGSVLVLVLIGLSLLVAQLEQLRERRRLLSSLVAFGTPRGTLCLSVLWQTALPIGLALALASAVGLALGSVLLRMTGLPVLIEWNVVLAMVGAGGALVLLVTLLSMPPLWRMMRPDGLRTE
ncbi:ABC transporter permease [Streptomyces sp. NBC_00536]|uniref:FtsX-like permease family protein n=1 Tax=Streptomyces sp. NBC_00536 TaxID=2975769 RepID=UPI002E818737|nr:FtsX-like permease family protein [Streptomyces sp. NBC_00536]WUC81030.1 ABC transporter permease [Streptomyces sp. NBC_00536]